MLSEKIHLDRDEKVIKIVRKHVFILLLKVFNILVVALLPIILWTILSANTSVNQLLGIDLDKYLDYFVYLYSLWLTFCWLAITYIWTDHYLDVWAITNKRIVTIEQVTLFHRNTGSFRLEKLQDVNVEISGLLATVLHYGTIELQTASGSEEEFKTNYIPHPRSLRSTILQAADKRIDRYNSDLDI